MARIPMSQGRATPNAVQNQFTPIDGLKQIGQVIQQGRDARAQIQEQQDAQAKQFELYQANVAEADAKTKVDDVLTTEVAEQVAKLRNDVGNGAISADDAKAQLQKFGDERWKTLSSDVPLFAQGKIQDTWNSAIARQGAGFIPFQIKATEQKAMTVADRAVTVAGRLSRENGVNLLNQAIGGLPIPEAMKQEKILQFHTDYDRNEAVSRIDDAFNNGSVVELKQVVADLNKPDVYKYLPKDQIRNLNATAQSRIATLQDREQIMLNKREGEAEKVLKNFQEAIFTGSPLSPALIQNTDTALKGTSVYADFQMMQKNYNKIQQFAKLPTAQQSQLLTEAKAGMATTGSNDPVADNKLLGVYEKIYNGKMKVLRDNPKQQLSELGLQVPDLNPMELSNNPKGFAENVLDIGSSLYALQQKDPNAQIQIFNNAEIAGARQAFEAMPVAKKLDFIGQLVTQAQNVKGGTKIYSSALGQLGNGNRAYTMAALAKMQNLRSTAGTELATAIVEGQNILSSKAIKLPSEMADQFNQYIGSSVTGSGASMMFDAYKATYAYLMQRDGKEIDPKLVDSKTSKLALELVSGGVYTQGNYKVSKPYGMDDDTFESKLDVAYQEAAKRTGLSADDLQDFVLERAPTKTPDGFVQYFMRDARGNYVRDKNLRNVALIMRGVRK